jgi:type IV pilus assembly protein PilC
MALIAKPSASKPAQKSTGSASSGGSKSGSPGAAQAAAKQLYYLKKAKSTEVKLDILTMFTQQLSAMLEAGLPLVNTLEALIDQIEDPIFKVIIREVRNDIAAGTPFSEACRKWPNAFPNIFCSLVEAGEASGAMAEMLAKVAGYFEASMKLQKKVKSAMTYPIAVISMATVLVNILLIFVVPVFGEMFSGFGKDLPGPTQFLIDFSDFMKGNILGFTQTKREFMDAAIDTLVSQGKSLADAKKAAKAVPIKDEDISALSYIPWNVLYIGTLVFVALKSLKKFVKTPRGRDVRDRVVLKMPVVGELVRKINVSRFCRTFSILLKGGVPILKAIEICSKASDNVYIEKACSDINKHLNSGGQLSEVISTQPYFPTIVRHMAKAGEQTGNVDGMLVKVSNFFDQDIDNLVGSLTQLMEPILICTLGIVIGGIVMAMFMPIFQLSSVVG